MSKNAASRALSCGRVLEVQPPRPYTFGRLEASVGLGGLEVCGRRVARGGAVPVRPRIDNPATGRARRGGGSSSGCLLYTSDAADE